MACRENGIRDTSEADCYYLVQFYDSNQDGVLSYSEFLAMTLPCESQLLRSEATQRPNYHVGQFDYLPREVELALTSLLEKELNMHRRIELLKQELEVRYDYSSRSAFKTVDDINYGFVDASSLKRFLKNAKHIPSERELAAIIRRLDLDADARLNFQEFSEGIRSVEPYSKILVRDKSKRSRSRGFTPNETVRTQALDRSFRAKSLNKSGGFKGSPNKSPLKFRAGTISTSSIKKKKRSSASRN